MKKKDTAEARAYWAEVEEIAKEVERWPEWKKSFATGYSSSNQAEARPKGHTAKPRSES